jgi:hypothetical protein
LARVEASGTAGLQTAVFQWEDGYARVQDARSDPGRHRALARAVAAVQDELRKRLGSRFAVAELVALYRERGDAMTDVAMAAVRADEDLTDVSAASDAAFYLYMREASDFGGGRPRRAPAD